MKYFFVYLVVYLLICTAAILNGYEIPRPVWITMQSVTGLFFLVAVILYLWKEVDNEQL